MGLVVAILAVACREATSQTVVRQLHGWSRALSSVCTRALLVYKVHAGSG